MRRLRTILLVAGFDLRHSLRSRKAPVLLALYVTGALVATGIFVRVLHAVETSAAEALGVAPTEKAGAMTAAVLHSKQFLKMMTALIHDRALAESLVSLPPLALFYGWLGLAFVPLLVTLASCDSVSSEVATGSLRFSLFRSDRFSWVAGKLVGETALMVVGIAAGAAATWIVGAVSLSGFEPLATAWWLARLSGRIAVYGFAYLGLAMGASQVTRSVNGSRGIALIALFLFGVSGGLLSWGTRWWPVVCGTALQIFPGGHNLDLWRPDLADRLPAMAILPALGLAYFSVGYAVFSRRDP